MVLNVPVIHHLVSGQELAAGNFSDPSQTMDAAVTHVLKAADLREVHRCVTHKNIYFLIIRL